MCEETEESVQLKTRGFYWSLHKVWFYSDGLNSRRRELGTGSIADPSAEFLENIYG